MVVAVSQVSPPDIDITQTFSPSNPILIDYRDMERFYIWCDNNLDVDAQDYGTLHLQASVWNEIPLPQGIRLTPVGTNASTPTLFNVLIKATNKSYIPVPPIEFDLAPLIAKASGPMLAPIGVPYYKLAALELSGAGWTGQVTVSQSVSGVVYNLTVVKSISDTAQALITQIGSNGLYRIPIIGKFLKIDVANLAGGNVHGNIIFFMNSVDV